MSTKQSKTSNHTNDKWFETKHEYEIVDGVQILKHVTKEKKKSEWYNSSIFLWFLGALFLTFIPWVWTKYQAGKEKSERIERIDNEISGRFNQLFDMVRRLSDSLSVNPLNNKETTNDTTQVNVKNMFASFKDRPLETRGRTKYYPSYKEFEDYSMITLLNQLVALDDKADKDKIRAVIAKMNYPDFIPTTPFYDNENVVDRIKMELYLERWQK